MVKQVSKKVVLAVALGLVAMVPVSAMAANKLIVKDAAGTTDKFVVTDKGYVGIGSTNPNVALDLVAPAGQARIVIQTVGTSTIGGGGFIGLHNNDLADNSGLPRKEDRIGFHLFGTKNGTTTVTSGGFQVMAEDNWTSTSYPTYFKFETVAPNTTTKYERFRISGNGNVGISASAPTQRLEVNGGVRLNTSTTKPACDTNSRGTIWFTKGAVGVADKIEVCYKNSSENYMWNSLF